MKFTNYESVKIILIGAGGSGGYEAPHLYRIAYASGKDVRIIIADGDIVEEDNLIRQNFVAADVGQNKARVMAERYANVFGVETEYIPRFIEDKDELMKLVKPDYWGYYHCKNQLVVLIGAVDNNRSRQLCNEVFNESNNLIYIDSGNGEYTGQVVCGVRKGGRTVMKPVARWYPDILKAEDKFPTEMSCAERSVHAPQSIAANLFASTIVTTLLYQLLITNEIKARKTTFSSMSCNVKSVRSERG